MLNSTMSQFNPLGSIREIQRLSQQNSYILSFILCTDGASTRLAYLSAHPSTILVGKFNKISFQDIHPCASGEIESLEHIFLQYEFHLKSQTLLKKPGRTTTTYVILTFYSLAILTPYN